MNEKITDRHLQRKAMLYIRQSSPHQVAHHQEGRRLQYAMRERLQQLGWSEIEVIDEDLGRSASGSVERTGFERMAAEVDADRWEAIPQVAINPDDEWYLDEEEYATNLIGGFSTGAP
jgi:hypothetical protein